MDPFKPFFLEAAQAPFAQSAHTPYNKYIAYIYIYIYMLYRYIHMGELIGYIYIYKYISQKVAICSLWTVCPC